MLDRLGGQDIEGDAPGQRLLPLVQELAAAGVDAEQSLRASVRTLTAPKEP
ncbi:MAG: hypothetical protein ACRDWI_16770 [Jiangellaceae bacterium]